MGKYDNYIGRVLADRYEIINVIGSGGSSGVFGVYDIKEDRTVAIKMLRSDSENNEDAVKRFEQEAELLSRFSHPGIVKIYDKYFDGFPKFFVMEYVEGITLKKHILSNGAMSKEEMFYFLKPILSALGEVHKQGIVHSDIKPQNVVVLSDGSIRLMDFGISTSQFSSCVASDEQPGVAVGTVHYVSPEQAEAKPLDARSDIYSLGVMMYEMATGILPFFGDKASNIALMHVNELPIAPSVVNPNVDSDVEEIILRSMEKLPEDRYQTAEEILEAIDRIENPIPKSKEPIPFKEKVKDYFLNFSIPSGIVGALCALLVTVVVGLGILSVTVIEERKAPKHVKVPHLDGIVFADIDSLGLDENYYEITVVYREDNKNRGKIISQFPSADEVIKLNEGEKCKIEVTVGQEPMPATVPNVTAMTYEDAKALLSSYGYGVTQTYATDDFMPEGRVISTIPASGETSAKEITVITSSGCFD